MRLWPQTVQLWRVVERTLSLDNAAKVHPWFLGIPCVSNSKVELDDCKELSLRSPVRNSCRAKYRFGWQFVVVLVLIAGSVFCSPLSWAADITKSLRVLPEVPLYDQQGEVFAEEQLLGKLSVVNFFFTSCPEACPTQMRKLSALYRNLPAVYDKPVNFVSFSVDPERDSQPVLAEYATKMKIDGHSWRLITGEPEALKKIRQDYGSVVQKIKPDALVKGSNIDHSLVVYLQDVQGRVLMTYVGADVDAARIQRDILTLQRLKRDIPLR